MLGTALSMAALCWRRYCLVITRPRLTWLLASVCPARVGEIGCRATWCSSTFGSLTQPIRHGIMVAVFYGALAIGYHLAGRVGAYLPILPKPVLFSGLAALVLFGCVVVASASQWF